MGFIPKTIYKITMILRFRVMDLCRILNTSLSNACKSFRCCQQKLSLQHNIVQSMYIKGKLSEYMTSNYEEVKKYNIMDVRTLSELYFKARIELLKLCGENIEDHVTLASMSYKLFKSRNMSLCFPVHKGFEKELVRKSIIGGRAQIFNRGEFNFEPLCCIDCVSLYPYVMLNNVFPIGESEPTMEYVYNKIGVYEVVVNIQPDVIVVPSRNKIGGGRGGSLNWSEKRSFRCILTSQDIDMLVKYGGNVQVIQGFYWKKDLGQLFQTYFNPLVEEKKKQDNLKGTDIYNAALRELCKLLMNSLSGKFTQHDYENIVEVVTNREQLNRFKQKCKSEVEVLDINNRVSIVSGVLQEYNNKMPTIYGSLIYSYGRSYMYDMVLSKVDKSQIFGMDTDSAFVTLSQYKILKQKYPFMFGDNFGQFKEEVLELLTPYENGPYGIFVSPKCYCFYAVDKKNNKKERFIKARFKGININRDKVWNSSLFSFEKLKAEDINALYYGDDLSVIDVSFFRLMLRQDVEVLHSNLNKKIVGTDECINIKQHFCVKRIATNESQR